MTPERKAALLAYCRVDELTPAEEALFEGMVQAAESYMEQAGIAGPDEGTPRRAQYDLCVNALVLDSWDRRGTMDTGKGTYQVTDNASFRRTINQLKLTELPPASNSDTEKE